MRLFFGPANGPGDRLGGGERGIDLQLAHRPPQGLGAIAGIVDRVVFLKPHERRVLPQQPGAEAVEGADPDLAAGGQPLDAEPHFVGRLVGERQGEDLVSRHAVGQHPCDAMGNDPRLSAARSGQDQQGAVVVQDGLPLGLGQVLQQMFHLANIDDIAQSWETPAGELQFGQLLKIGSPGILCGETVVACNFGQEENAVVARNFRYFEKKRGHRRTGSRLLRQRGRGGLLRRPAGGRLRRASFSASPG